MGLEYKIVGRRQIENDVTNQEYVDVEWTHTDGPITDYHTVPVTHPPEIQYETKVSGKRDIIHDCVIVKPHTKDSIVMQMLEEKREALAKNLGVTP